MVGISKKMSELPLQRHLHRCGGLTLTDTYTQRERCVVLFDGKAHELSAKYPALERVAHVDAGQLLQRRVVPLMAQQGQPCTEVCAPGQLPRRAPVPSRVSFQSTT